MRDPVLVYRIKGQKCPGTRAAERQDDGFDWEWLGQYCSVYRRLTEMVRKRWAAFTPRSHPAWIGRSLRSSLQKRDIGIEAGRI